MRSCFAAQLDMVGFESFFYCTWLLYVLSRIFGHRYNVPYLKCNAPPKEKSRRIFVRQVALRFTFLKPAACMYNLYSAPFIKRKIKLPNNKIDGTKGDLLSEIC